MSTDGDATPPPRPEPSDESPSVSTARTAPHPFDKPSADVVIRSCDRVEFRVRSHIIIEASPVLETMLAQPSSPLLKLPEDSQTIDTLLRICYPIVDPDSYMSPGEVESALRAAMKYDMALPVKFLTYYVESTTALSSPLQAWRIACRLDLEDLARHAAKQSLRHDDLDFTGLGDMEGISAGQYYRLMEYRRKQGDVAEDYLLLKHALEEDTGASSGSPPSPPSPPSFHDMPAANLICRSSDGVEFRVRKDLLSDASSELRETVQAAERKHNTDVRAGTTSSGEDEDKDIPAMPCVALEENAAVLAQLFSFHRLGANSFASHDLHTLANVMVAARKYNAHGLYELAQLRLSALARSSPLETYLVTITRGLDDLARAAASKAIDLPLETTYLEELEHCPALHYYRLLLYRDDCQDIATRNLDETYLSRPTPGVPRPVEVGPVATRTNAPGPQLAPRSTSPTSASSGPDDICVSSSDSLRLRHFRSKSAWLPAYVTSVFEQTRSRPGTAKQKEKMLFVDATNAGNAWCRQCQLLARDLLDLRTSLRSIPAKVREVVLAM